MKKLVKTILISTGITAIVFVILKILKSINKETEAKKIYDNIDNEAIGI